ncbi:hypothetical protein MTR_4g115130 [Medicago truncatula]|uniref:Uncharacterized protein n=1 Tax=Medicago truncatula TaxID=3880 RepID=G7JE79_MEDTR|nr:hypothetical protein MTR_4g115130 [Medicago truncatula]
MLHVHLVTHIGIYLYFTSMPRERTSDGIANVIKYVLDHLSTSFDQTMIYDMTLNLNCLISVT